MSSESTKNRHRSSKRTPSPLQKERRRNWENRKSRSRSPIRRHGEKNLEYAHHNNQDNRQSSYTASKTSDQAMKTKEKTSGGTRTNPYTVFSQHRANHSNAPGWCGFYWHSTRLARNGTNSIFNEMKQKFQELQIDGKINWDTTRELLFTQKKTLDQSYRNMLYHFRHSPDCSRCEYWDDVYRKHLANVSSQESEEVTDEEMLSAVESMETNASN
nr:NP1 [Human bocavirus]AJE63442.1 NP1 [Human bocavirus]